MKLMKICITLICLIVWNGSAVGRGDIENYLRKLSNSYVHKCYLEMGRKSVLHEQTIKNLRKMTLLECADLNSLLELYLDQLLKDFKYDVLRNILERGQSIILDESWLQDKMERIDIDLVVEYDWSVSKWVISTHVTNGVSPDEMIWSSVEIEDGGGAKKLLEEVEVHERILNTRRAVVDAHCKTMWERVTSDERTMMCQDWMRLAQCEMRINEAELRLQLEEEDMAELCKLIKEDRQTRIINISGCQWSNVIEAVMQNLGSRDNVEVLNIANCGINRATGQRMLQLAERHKDLRCFEYMGNDIPRENMRAPQDISANPVIPCCSASVGGESLESNGDTLLTVAQNELTNADGLHAVLRSDQMSDNLLTTVLAHNDVDYTHLLSVVLNLNTDVSRLQAILRHPQVTSACLTAIGNHSQVDADLLLNVAKHPQAGVDALLTVAQNRLTDASGLYAIVSNPNVNNTILATVAAHENVTVDLLNEIVSMSNIDAMVIAAVVANQRVDANALLVSAQNPLINLVELQVIIEHPRATNEILTRVANNPQINAELLKAIASRISVDADTLLEVARNPITDRDGLSAVVHNPGVNSQVIAVVAARRDISDLLLIEIAARFDIEADALLAIVQNPSTNSIGLNIVLNNPNVNPEVLTAIAAHNAVHSANLLAISRNLTTNIAGLRAVLHHPQVTSDCLMAIMTHPHADVELLRNVGAHPKANEAVRSAMVQDSSILNLMSGPSNVTMTDNTANVENWEEVSSSNAGFLGDVLRFDSV